MDSFLFLLCFVLSSSVFVSGTTFTEFAYPNLTASNFKFVDTYGSFLFSRNGTFKASMFNPHFQRTKFYLCVLHVQSNTIIWSANRDSPVSESGTMSLTGNGITITEGGNIMWSTPTFSSLVSALKLEESGNLVLLDRQNVTLWESFRNPTDTFVIGQRIPVGTVLYGGVSHNDLSRGDYAFSLTSSDVSLQWGGSEYWKLSMAVQAHADTNYAVEFMAINQTGLYLYGNNGSAIVIQVKFPRAEFRVAKIDESGRFIVSSFYGIGQNQDFLGPDDECRIPFICGKIGVCVNGITGDNPICSCPFNFRVTLENTTTCIPADNSQLLPVSCNVTTGNNTSNLTSSNISYLQLGDGVDYFANNFMNPARNRISLSTCKDLCTSDCTCLGIFFDNSSGSCFTIENNLGSFMLTTRTNTRQGFIKAVSNDSATYFNEHHLDPVGFSTAIMVLIPLSGLLLMFIIGVILCRKYSLADIKKVKLGFSNSLSGDLNFSIPGLPLRFEYEELAFATNSFKTKIGSGGFGTVYQGMLPDKTLVAVKKINNLDVRGKKDFCTEIAVIGNIHHVNLVKLKGYCAQRTQWLLVYEYMNRGSLDKTLFNNNETALEWPERVEIAVGAARGLAYLHYGCDQKIIHCDVKPENILLHDHLQAKISDFGLSKLLNREQSMLFTTMRGTRGYLAPEWLTSSALSDKTDVYSFGMVLLELVSGRKNCSGQNPNEQNPGSDTYFPLYALEMHEKGQYLELADPRLEGRVMSEDVEKLIRVALCCVHEEPGLRPTMVSVVGMLEGQIPLGEPRMESLNFLRFYGRRFAENSVHPEEGGERIYDHDEMLYREANASQSSTRSVSTGGFSYVTSEQISGPR